MQKREQLSAKLLQSSSNSNVNLNETSRIITSTYRNRSATTVEANFMNTSLNASTSNSNIHTLSMKLKNHPDVQSNGRVAQVDSSKFLEEILSNRRKSSEVYTNSNQYVTSSTIQTLSLVSSSSNSNNTARTNEERALHPDKLILDR
jgi:hypothetical protein